MKGKVAYVAIPESGGLFRFYLNLRKALKSHGWDVLAPCVGPSAHKRWDDEFADEGCHLVAGSEKDPERSAKELVSWIEANDINILMPMDCSIAASAIPHMSSSVRVVTRCSTLSDFGYRISLLCPERLNRVVVMTPAQERGISRYSDSEGKVELIPHGVDVEAIKGVSRRAAERAESVLRLLYLGRLEDRSKGVLFIPKILSCLGGQGVDFEMDIIGDGPDRLKLDSELKRLGIKDRVNMTGTLHEAQVVERLNTIPYDIMLMPSRYEGFPNAVLEGMAAGIVPVVSSIEGISDFVIEDGVSGLACPIGNTDEFASAVASLAADRNRLRAMSLKARETVCDRFSLERMGRDYDHLFEAVLAEPEKEGPLPWDAFSINRNYRPSWRNHVPDWAKNLLRRYKRI